MTQATRQDIRFVYRDDMPQVLAIENESCDYPWDHDAFVDFFKARNSIGVAYILGESEVAGFMLYELHKRCYHIVSIAVAVRHRRSGFGRRMVDKLRKKLPPHRTALTLDIRERNLAGQLFFRSLGFVATGVVRQPYMETTEDAYRMEWSRPDRRRRKLDEIDIDDRSPR